MNDPVNPKPEDIGDILRAWQSILGILGSAVCHDLNNPLQGVIGFMDLLVHTEQDSKRKADLEYVLTYGNGCRKIADSVGKLVEKYPPVCSTFNAEGYWEEILALCQKRWAEKKLRFETSVSVKAPPVEIDPYYFIVILYGVLENCCMRSSPGSKVIISLTFGDPGRLRLKVKLNPADPEKVLSTEMGEKDMAALSALDNKSKIGADENHWLWLAGKAARIMQGRLESTLSSDESSYSVLVDLPDKEE